jgi:hypothetical protein
LATCRRRRGRCSTATGCAALQTARHQQARRHGRTDRRQFEPNPPIEPMRIINLIQKDRNYKLAGQDKLIAQTPMPTLADRVAAVKDSFIN